MIENKLNSSLVLELNEEIQNHRGELVIHRFQIVRLEDVIDEGDDYYWVYNKFKGCDGLDENDKGLYEASCVGSHTRIKGFIPDEKYNRILNTWNLNNYVKAI